MSVTFSKTLWLACQFVFQNIKNIYLQAVPFIFICIGLFWVSQESPFQLDRSFNRLLIDDILLVMSAPLAISVYRAILLGEGYDQNYVRTLLSYRCLSYSLFALFGSLVSRFIFFVESHDVSVGLSLLLIVAACFTVYVSYRLVGVFSLIAINEKNPFKGAWAISKGYFWKLVCLSLVSCAPYLIVHMIFSRQFGAQETFSGATNISITQAAILLFHPLVYVFGISASAAVFAFFVMQRREQNDATPL